MAGTTTVLFTDIPNSTETLFQMGDSSGAAALTSHLDELRAVVEHHRGRVHKTLGDGVMAVFAAAYDGVCAAIAMQQAIDLLARRGVGPPFGLRVGIHVGDIVDDGDQDAFGSTVVVARRLCDAAAPGQIMASEVIRLLVGNRPDLHIEAVGPLRLKGVPDPVSAVAVRWDPLPEVPPLRVVVAEDAALIRGGIVRLLASEGFEVVADVADHDALIAAVDRERPDLVVTDIRMPPTQTDEGLRAAAYIKARHPTIAVLVLSQHVAARAAAHLLDGQTAGIGYLLKERVGEIDQFVDIARRVAAGESVIDTLITEELLRLPNTDALHELTDRERDVLGYMAQGLSNHAIATALVVSDKTIETHVRSIFQKLDLVEDPAGNRRVQAVIRWLDQRR